jgi:glycogen operon protein
MLADPQAATSTPVRILGPGTPAPLGATPAADGINVSVYAKRATGVDLLLFDDAEDRAPRRVLKLSPEANRTGAYWHALVGGIGPGQLYGYRVTGPWAPERGLRFDPSRVLLDPYGTGVALPDGYRPSTHGGAAGDPVPMKSIVTDPGAYDWEGDRPLGRSFRDTIIYEAHVAGFTADPGSGVDAGRRGRYRGFIDRIPYLVDLGVTAVELLPVFAFDPYAAPAGLINYWGYQPVSFFAPHPAYATDPTGQAPLDEFRDLVKALHRAGLEVILDVVFNHTAEGGAGGPTFSLKGFANDDYYLLGADRSTYVDASGTGNTLNANGTIVRRMILDSLRYWVREMHVDGFRFDLAAVLSRDEAGDRMANPPTIWDIETDPVLAGTKLIAEAWDAGGLYEVGSFVGDRWAEWNGVFRDDVRAFVRSDPGKARAAALRFLGSPDIYGSRGRDPQVSVNFVTCHDGFTLQDLVSYDAKHNEANGEDGRDGNDQNLSWNCGVEGPTDDPAIEALRARQVRNLLAFTLLASGAPMLLMGDEVRRTQGGNNNAYCHDDPLAWFAWSDVERHADVHRFTRELIRLRQRLVPLFNDGTRVGLTDVLRDAAIEWSGVHAGEPDTSDASRSIALTSRRPAGSIHLVFNAYWEALDFELPPTGIDGVGWTRIVDTALPSPADIGADRGGTPWPDATYRVTPRSVVVLVARPAVAATDGATG